ncbi:MAG: polymer-forming cytoskeletal protein [Myxococcota bacterium]|nr:polymer-forming cytoskeletal protein [Myxococcota bacterium]
MPGPRGRTELPEEVLVPEGGRFEGRVYFRGEKAVHGEVVGPIEAAGRLTVGPEGRIQGSVRAESLTLAGRIEGEVVALERACLEEGATLRGTLSSPRVSVAEGALLEGPCRVGPLDGEGSPESKSP